MVWRMETKGRIQEISEVQWRGASGLVREREALRKSHTSWQLYSQGQCWEEGPFQRRC